MLLPYFGFTPVTWHVLDIKINSWLLLIKIGKQSCNIRQQIEINKK